ncbi:hypothetical protein AB4X15_10925 [Peribacillus simplex]
MAGNSGKNHRDGAVKNRTQFKALNGNYGDQSTITPGILQS